MFVRAKVFDFLEAEGAMEFALQGKNFFEDGLFGPH